MKKTRLLQSVSVLLNNSDKPMSVRELMENLATEKYNLHPNKTSLYRLLERMKNEGMVRDINIAGDRILYEANTDHQHYHFMCTKCGNVSCEDDAEIATDIVKLKKKLSRQGFDVQEHQLSFSGTCHDCGTHEMTAS